ncbi:hypothetical protein LWM68_42815 [Niabella sp. W65]|nr:hypothetical protein [Niabella sp. W65]MCH7368878.1 hypothetical protein [Niabella sp. W65]
MSLIRYESQARAPLVEGNKTYHDVTEDICRPVEAKPSKLWWVGFIISLGLLGFVCGIHLYGCGVWYWPVEPE